MSTSLHASHIAAAGAFAVGLGISAWSIYKSYRVQAEYRRHSSEKPSVSKEALIVALRNIADEAQRAVQSVEDALAGASEETGEKHALELTARSTVQKELDNAQGAALKALGISAEQAAAAISYYTTGVGSDEEVVEQAQRIKSIAGKYVLTKQTVLSVMEKTYQLQSEMMLSAAEDAVESGAVRSAQQLQRFLGGPFQSMLKHRVESFTQEETGIGMEEIDELTKKPEWMEDPVFQAGVARVAQQGQQSMQETNAKLGQLLQQLQASGGRGGMGGMGGMGMGGMGGMGGMPRAIRHEEEDDE